MCFRGSPLRLGTRRESGRGGANPEGAGRATSCEELTHWKRLGCWEGLADLLGPAGVNKREAARAWVFWEHGIITYLPPCCRIKGRRKCSQRTWVDP